LKLIALSTVLLCVATTMSACSDEGTCERIVEACHDKDEGSGVAHDCHELAEGAATDEECANSEDACLTACGE
jgi:hypothetical protein